MVFFFAALAEAQVTVLTVLNPPQQGLPLVQLGTVVFAARCFFASEILCDSPAYNKQRMNKKSLNGRVAWKPKMHDDVHLASLLFAYGLLLGKCGYQANRKIYDQSEIIVAAR